MIGTEYLHQSNLSGVEVAGLRWHTGAVTQKSAQASFEPRIPVPGRSKFVASWLGPRIFVGPVLAVLAVLVVTSPADATWSIVAVDPETAEVGAAIASCVPAEFLGQPSQPLVPLVLIPGTAVAVTQAQLNLDVPDRIAELVAVGATPDEIIADLTAEEFDEVAPLRQHAVVALPTEVAAFTGSETEADSLDRQGPSVSVQGNLLVSTTGRCWCR